MISKIKISPRILITALIFVLLLVLLAGFVYFYKAKFTGQADETDKVKVELIPGEMTLESLDEPGYFRVNLQNQNGEINKAYLLIYLDGPIVFTDPQDDLGDFGLVDLGDFDFSNPDVTKVEEINNLLPAGEVNGSFGIKCLAGTGNQPGDEGLVLAWLLPDLSQETIVNANFLGSDVSSVKCPPLPDLTTSVSSDQAGNDIVKELTLDPGESKTLYVQTKNIQLGKAGKSVTRVYASLVGGAAEFDELLDTTFDIPELEYNKATSNQIQFTCLTKDKYRAPKPLAFELKSIADSTFKVLEADEETNNIYTVNIGCRWQESN